MSCKFVIYLTINEFFRLGMQYGIIYYNYSSNNNMQNLLK